MTTTPTTPPPPDARRCTSGADLRRVRAHLPRADRGRLGGRDRVGAAGPLDRQLGRRPGHRARSPSGCCSRGTSAPAEEFTIDECEPPHRLGDHHRGALAGRHARDLAPASSTSPRPAASPRCTFAQSVPDPTMAESVGPGWDYYLDRMVLAEAGDDPGTLDFDDYYPALVRALPRRVRLRVLADQGGVEPVALFPLLEQHVVPAGARRRRTPRSASPASSGPRPPTTPPAHRRAAARRARWSGTAHGRAPRWCRGPGSPGRCRRPAGSGRTTPVRASAIATAMSAITTTSPLVGQQRRAVGDGAVAHPPRPAPPRSRRRRTSRPAGRRAPHAS